MTNTTPKPFVFVLMPFSSDFDDIYQLGIKPACNNAGAYAERIDDQLFQESILDRVYNQISKADIILADMTGRNPNVFYEVGYAHALGKSVILLTQNKTDIPFDLLHYPHIIYGGKIMDLIPEVEKRVKHVISQPTHISYFDKKIELFIDRISLLHEPIIDYTIKSDFTTSLSLKLDVHNCADKTIQKQVLQLGVETSDIFDYSEASIRIQKSRTLNIVKLPEGGLLHLLEDKLEILPGGWETVFIHLYASGPKLEIGEKDRLSVRLFTEDGVRKYPFQIHVFKKN
jgi:hypothetical protein